MIVDEILANFMGFALQEYQGLRKIIHQPQ